MSKFSEIKALIGSAEFELKKFESKKIKSSGSKVRAALLDIKKLCDSLRKDIQAEIKAIPKKERKVKMPSKVQQAAEMKKEIEAEAAGSD